MKYVIFDLDGTLIDSMQIWEHLGEEVLAGYGMKLPPELKKEIETLTIHQSAELFKKKFNLSARVSDIVSQIEDLGQRKYREEVQLKPHVQGFLKKLRAQKIPMAIATTSMKNGVTAVLKRLNILEYFEFILTAEDAPLGKNDPEIFTLCAQRFCASPGEIWVFEDALHAACTAKKAGFIVVGVYDQASAKDRPALKAVCDFYIDTLEEAENLL